MANMSSQFRNLIAWQKGVDLAVRTYRVCESLPPYERFGLAQQMRRASVSVPSNVAEGCGRGTLPDYRRFLLQARGSVYELETQIEIAKRIGFINETDALGLTSDATDVARLINGIIRELNARR
jgi:four helix bundle protein